MQIITREAFFKANSIKSMANLLQVSTKTLSKRIKEILPQYQGKKIATLYPKDLQIIYAELVE